MKTPLPLLRMSLKAAHFEYLASVTDDVETRHHLLVRAMIIRMVMNRADSNYHR